MGGASHRRVYAASRTGEDPLRVDLVPGAGPRVRGTDDLFPRQTPYSDPGGLDVSDLPRDPRELMLLVRNLMVHRLEGERIGYAIPEERLHHGAESRYVTALLRILRARRDAPLTRRRSSDERFVGTCRDFSLLLCSLPRATGTPSRIRGGYATCFVEGLHDDHRVTEYRLADGTWRPAGAQVAAAFHDVPFDPSDVPRNRFPVSGQAWRACRAGTADPATFGVWVDPVLRVCRSSSPAWSWTSPPVTARKRFPGMSEGWRGRGNTVRPPRTSRPS
ncbi:hypothetical protein J2X68_004594 [Streptomyces sp. 3330]|uniref:transglutaminase domain-containing protein n=1 Tax=Streptomyces sp. 3330 TaxID=2817755 RepID=UPI00285643A4|nr:transglutaminase domain-containing protein [Streptomyces sp. 3330]MDR6977870.1 hypothetical protein [Streptomyces sp. 3330]